MNIDLYQLATDAGMTEQEYIKAISLDYAAHMSLVLEENPGKMITYTVNYMDHDIEITARRVNDKSAPKNASIN